jgi:hypothetical protein
MSTLLKSADDEITIQRPTPWHHIAIFLASCGLLIVILVVLLKGSLAFGTCWSSGRAVAQGLNPYAALPLTSESHLFIHGHQEIIKDINLNPPCLLPLFQVMSYLSVDRFRVAWIILSSLLLIGSIGPLRRNRPRMQMRQLLWLAASWAVFDTFHSGQIYFLLLFLSTLVLIFDEGDHELAASAALGILVAVKPTTAFWPLFLFLAGRRRLAIRSLFLTLIVSAISVALYGPRIYKQWLNALKDDPHWIIPSDIALPAYFARLGARMLGTALAAMVAAGLAYFVWKRKPGFLTTSGIALCVTILCAPLAWPAYTLMLAPFFSAFRWRKLETAAALLLVVPSGLLDSITPSGSLGGLIAVSAGYFTAVWLILISFMRQQTIQLRFRTHLERIDCS